MKAAVCTGFGPPEVVRVMDVPLPPMKGGDVRVRVLATTVSSGDWRIRARAMPRGFGPFAGPIFGFRRPRQPILGSELVGVVDAVGGAVSRFAIGDPVVAFPGIKQGAHAEFCVLPENGRIIPRPSGLTDEQAASLFFGGTTALHYLRNIGGIRAGQRVLVLGAAGTVGSAAVQLAHHFGAQVTAVASAPHHEALTAIGAQELMDYTKEDFADSNQRWDLILDAVGMADFARARRVLAPDGRFLMVAADLPAMIGALRTSFSRPKALSGVTPESPDDMRFLARLAETGEYRPLVDSVYALEQVAQAHARVESRRKRGSVVLRLG